MDADPKNARTMNFTHNLLSFHASHKLFKKKKLPGIVPDKSTVKSAVPFCGGKKSYKWIPGHLPHRCLKK